MEKLYIRIDENNEVIGYPMPYSNVIFHCMAHFPISYEGVTEEFILSHGFAIFEKPTLETGQYVVNEDDATFKLYPDGKVRPILEIKELTQEEKVEIWVRRARDRDLLMSDWTQLPDAPLTPEKKAEWAAYREQLRNLTIVYANVKTPSEIIPPTKPN
jgi:hypothetical protein